MTRVVWDPFTGAPPSAEGRLAPQAMVAPAPHSPWVKLASVSDGVRFEAGRGCGMRVAACLARLDALELLDGSRWWNRRGRRVAARALVAHAEGLEKTADADGRCPPCAPRPEDEEKEKS